jgi:endo-1,4-beta-xylanase
VFRWAHKADPKALLFYHEAEGEGRNRKSKAIYAMVKDFRSRGVLIAGVGLQMHIPLLDADLPAVAANLARRPGCKSTVPNLMFPSPSTPAATLARKTLGAQPMSIATL